MHTAKNNIIVTTIFFILLIISIIIVYFNTLNSPFMFDDLYLIVENKGIGELKQYLKLNSIFDQRPLVDLTFSLNYIFNNLNTFYYHLVNIIMHILNAFLVFLLTKKVLHYLTDLGFKPNNNKSYFNSIFLISAFSSVIFALHPLQTQAVNYIAQRYTIAATLFYFLCVFLYIKGREKQILCRKLTENVLYVFNLVSVKIFLLFFLSALAALFAFLSKQNAASLPAAILMVEYLFFSRHWSDWRGKVKFLLPIFGFFVVFVLYAIVYKGQGLQLGNVLHDLATKTRETESISRFDYLFTQFQVVLIYLRMFFIPVGQNIDHMYPFVQGFWHVKVVLSFSCLVSILFLGVYWIRKYPVLSFSIFWFFIALSVESSVFPIKDALFEHRLYLPMFGLGLISAYAIYILLSGKIYYYVVAGVILAVLLSSASFVRNQAWSSRITIWQDSVGKNPNNYRAYNNLGEAHLDEVNLSDAEKCFKKSLQINAKNYDAYLNLGLTLAKQGELSLAIDNFKSALKYNSDFFKAHFNLAKSYQMQGSYEKALTNYGSALKIDSSYPGIHQNLCKLYLESNKIDKALIHAKKLAELKENSFSAWYNLAIMQYKMNNLLDSLKNLDKSLKSEPENNQALYLKAIILAKLGKLKKSLVQLEKILKLDPDNERAVQLKNNLSRYLNE